MVLCRVVNSLETERQKVQEEEEEQTEAEAAEPMYIDDKGNAHMHVLKTDACNFNLATA